MAAQDKLLYFDGTGRAEPIRMLYSLANQPLTDERFATAEWPKYKPGTPLQQVPVYTCAEGTLVMSNTIARYTAKKFGFMGDNLWEEAQVDMIMEALSDTFGMLGRKILRWKVYNMDPEPENSEKIVEEFYGELVKTLRFVQKVAEERGRKFLVSDKISLADIWLLNCLEHAVIAYPHFLEENTWAKEFMSKISSNEKMKNYLDNRPANKLLAKK